MFYYNCSLAQMKSGFCFVALNALFCLKKQKLRKSEVFRVKIPQRKVTKCNIYKNSLFFTIISLQFSRKFTRKTTKMVKVKKNIKTITKLKRKVYYIRVRAYKTVKGKIYYSKWSNVKKVRIKK